MSAQAEQTQSAQTVPTIVALLMAANMVSTDPGVIAGIINRATPEERAGVKNLKDLLALYFVVHARVVADVSAKVESTTDHKAPLVNLADFAETLKENFSKPGESAGDDITDSDTYGASVTRH
ncbi:hypothetical protein [Ralstonia phage P-PSG-11-1]|uniref:Uncharacterized protein n=1 Tax=Ralstonia phage P-PSG-11 TaxID=2652430 RepID=A0A5P8D4Y8_9CAUD|nr:hypothetical protein [Ralstonia phage P-PSG-11]QFP93749.1 hypothetical protein [Ralstonia phage P-PSG-11-1]